MDYKKQFKDIPIETKLKDLIAHPMIDTEKISKASDEEITQVYYEVFSALDMAMKETLGESMFDFGDED